MIDDEEEGRVVSDVEERLIFRGIEHQERGKA